VRGRRRAASDEPQGDLEDVVGFFLVV